MILLAQAQAAQPEIPQALYYGIAGYGLFMLAIGWWCSLKVKSSGDFLLGGRRLGPWLSAISERASGESAWFLMGLPGAAYASGFVEFWAVIGISMGILLSWIFIAGPLRKACDGKDILTLPEYFGQRFPKNANLIRYVCAAAFLFFYTVYLSAQIVGTGVIFSFLGVENISLAMILGAIVVIAYTLMGGFLAVAWTDLFQGLLMAGIAVLVPLLILQKHGYSDLMDILHSQRPESFFAMTNAGLSTAVEGLQLGAILGALSWGIGYLGQPHLITRYMAVKKSGQIRSATFIAMGWVLFAYWGIVFLGAFAVAEVDLVTGEQQQLVVAHLANSSLMPSWLGGFVLAGVLAAIMSSADSQLMVATSVVSEDICVRAWGISWSKKSIVQLTRVIALAIAVLSLVMAIQNPGLIKGIVDYAWCGLGSSIGPALILTLWWKPTSGLGVFTGILLGLSTTIAWDKFDFFASLPDKKISTFVIATVGVIVVSLLTPEKSEETPVSA